MNLGVSSQTLDLALNESEMTEPGSFNLAFLRTILSKFASVKLA